MFKFILLEIVFVFSSFSSFAQEEEWIKMNYEELKTSGCILQREPYKIINNQNEYFELLSKKTPFLDCSFYVLPTIDLNRKTLICFSTNIGGGGYDLSLSLMKDLNAEQVRINMTVIEKGYLRNSITVKKWLLIEKTAQKNISIEVNKIRPKK